MLSNRSAPSLWLIAVGALAVVLVVASVLVNLLLDDRSGDLLAADTPEGVVQRYLRAIADDEVEVAYDFIGEDVPGGCTLQHFLQTTRFQRERDFRARLLGTINADDESVVSVEITEPDDGIFGGSGFDYDVNFTLAEVSPGEWRFTEPPWPMAWCPDDPRSGIPGLALNAAERGAA